MGTRWLVGNLKYRQFLLAAISASMLLILDSRYRSFSTLLHTFPFIQLSLSLYLPCYSIRLESRIYYILAMFLVLPVAYCLILEFNNIHATL